MHQANEAMGVEGQLTGVDEDGQAYQWTQDHEVPFEPPPTGDETCDLLNAKAAAANHLKSRVVDAVWVGRFEKGRLVRFARDR